jgi:hypothetical protein
VLTFAITNRTELTSSSGLRRSSDAPVIAPYPGDQPVLIGKRAVLEQPEVLVEAVKAGAGGIEPPTIALVIFSGWTVPVRCQPVEDRRLGEHGEHAPVLVR